nr:PREDICTED: uncharacterized protein LOC109038100 isoform X1 [Bemisia tabaci]
MVQRPVDKRGLLFIEFICGLFGKNKTYRVCYDEDFNRISIRYKLNFCCRTNSVHEGRKCTKVIVIPSKKIYYVDCIHADCEYEKIIGNWSPENDAKNIPVEYLENLDSFLERERLSFEAHMKEEEHNAQMAALAGY